MDHTLTPPPSFSTWSLFWGAEPIVQAVMLMLVAASIWSWAIIFSKFVRLRYLTAQARQFEESFWSSQSLDTLYDRLNNRPKDPLSSMFCAAMREWRRSFSQTKIRTLESRQTLHQRIERAMILVSDREMDRLENHIGFLASTGSTAPFIGLFGTVLGIMHSFESIAAQQNTNLAVVAPGIAEALFATALGLVAAIPAVLAYNKLTSEFSRYANRLNSFVSEFQGIVSRQLEDQAA